MMWICKLICSSSCFLCVFMLYQWQNFQQNKIKKFFLHWNFLFMITVEKEEVKEEEVNNNGKGWKSDHDVMLIFLRVFPTPPNSSS